MTSLASRALSSVAGSEFVSSSFAQERQQRGSQTAVGLTSTQRSCRSSRIVAEFSASAEVNLKKAEQVESRRMFLAASLVSATAAAQLLTTADVARADEAGSSPSLFSDPKDGFSLEIPAGWEQGQGPPTRTSKILAWHPAGDTSTNLSLVITMLGADYTKMGSFGTVEAFGENLVNSMDRSWKRPPGQKAVLLNTESKKGLYFVDYSIQKVGEERRVFQSAVGMYDNGTYSRLYTLTGQYPEADAAKSQAIIAQAINSFKVGKIAE